MAEVGVSIGEFLRARREALGLNQNQVAKRTSLKHQQVYGKVETGRRQLRFSEALDLAAVLGFSIEEAAEAMGLRPEAPGLDLAGKVRLLRAAADHVTLLWPGRVGLACAEWLTGEANCHEAQPPAAEAVADLVDTIAGEQVAEIRMLISTLDAACRFARAVLTVESPGGVS